MNELETGIRDAVARATEAPVDGAGILAGLPAALVRRRRRRRAAGATSIALVATLITVAVPQLVGGKRSAIVGTPTGSAPTTQVSTAGPPTPSPDVASPSPSPSPTDSPSALAAPVKVVRTLPWLDKHVAINSRVGVGYTLPTTRTAAPPCTSSQLDMSAQVGFGAGSSWGALLVYNASASACSLYGAPTLALADDRGVVFSSSTDKPYTDGEPAKTVILEPNSWAATGNWGLATACGGTGATTVLRVRLPTEPTVITTLPFVFGTSVARGPCAVDHPDPTPARPHPGQMGTPPFAAITPQPSCWEGDPPLVQLLLPPTVRAGQTLRYRVVLSWADHGGVGYCSPPLFDQHIGAAPLSMPTPYEMRWDPVISRPGEGVAFDMRLEVPPDTPPGLTTLTWQFVEPSLDPVTATITVVG